MAALVMRGIPGIQRSSVFASPFGEYLPEASMRAAAESGYTCVATVASGGPPRRTGLPCQVIRRVIPAASSTLRPSHAVHGWPL